MIGFEQAGGAELGRGTFFHWVGVEASAENILGETPKTLTGVYLTFDHAHVGLRKTSSMHFRGKIDFGQWLVT